QIRKGFFPRTSTATPKVIRVLSKATTKMKKRQRNRLRVRSRKRRNQSEHSAYSATGKKVKGTN
ncbi:hypothetical protein, partial [Vibrio parahaemolyticus]|uniref:hypothetical protein n=1 Tax=Vibrio parahaemolyticus TaxID=670 RepID=UPI001C2F5E03